MKLYYKLPNGEIYNESEFEEMAEKREMDTDDLMYDLGAEELYWPMGVDDFVLYEREDALLIEEYTKKENMSAGKAALLLEALDSRHYTYRKYDTFYPGYTPEQLAEQLNDECRFAEDEEHYSADGIRNDTSWFFVGESGIIMFCC